MEPTIVKAVKKKRYGYHSIVITLSDGTAQEIKELSATDAHLDNIKYKVCCPMCDNKECVKGTLECEAEQWKRKKKNEH